jgi:hypothetical protein
LKQNGLTTTLTSVPILAHAPRDWKLHTAIPIKAAVVFAVQNTTVFTNIRRSTLTRPKSIANSLRFPCKQHEIVVFDSTRDLSTIYFIKAAMSAVLGIVIVVLAYRTWACKVAAINAIEAGIALAKSIRTDSVVTTVPCAAVNI